MKMPALHVPLALLTTVTFALLLATPNNAAAAPAEFELNLKELKKPATNLVPAQKQPAAKKTVKQQAAAKTPAKKPAAPKKTPPKSGNEPSIAGTPPVTPAPAERTVRLTSATACGLALQLLKTVATPMPVEEALHGVVMPATAAARLQNVTAVLACGLPVAETYTFTRLLASDDVQLISLQGNESPTQVLQSVAQGLGLSFRQKQEHPLSYVTTDPQGAPLLMQVGSDAAP